MPVSLQIWKNESEGLLSISRQLMQRANIVFFETSGFFEEIGYKSNAYPITPVQGAAPLPWTFNEVGEFSVAKNNEIGRKVGKDINERLIILDPVVILLFTFKV